MNTIQTFLTAYLKKPEKILLGISLFYLLLFTCKALYLQKTVYGDGRFYYSILRSIAIDHNLHFDNEYAHFQIEETTTPKGYKKNVYAIGPALLWLPAFTFLHPIINGDGYTFPYQYFVGLVSVVYTLLGLLLMYRVLQPLVKPISLSLTLIGLAIGTNLLFYGSLDTVNSHSLSFFAATLLFTLIIQKQHAFLIGLVIGILSLIRSQDIIFVILLLPTLSLLVPASLGILLAFIPQLTVWHIMYGTFLTSPYLSPYHYFDIYHPQIINVLFSTQNGLLLYTPLVGACIMGLCFTKFPILIKRGSILALFAAELYIISSWSFWWQGESFSGRMFIGVLPFLSLGLIAFIEKFPLKISTSIVMFGSLLNLFIIVYYLYSH
jgi:hypothetical protein